MSVEKCPLSLLKQEKRTHSMEGYGASRALLVDCRRHQGVQHPRRAVSDLIFNCHVLLPLPCNEGG